MEHNHFIKNECEAWSTMILDRNTIKEQCIPQMKMEWRSAADSFPDFLQAVSRESQKQNEQYLQSVLEDFQLQLKSLPVYPIRRKKWRQETLRMIEAVLSKETILNVHQYMDHQAIGTFQEELKEFFRHARKFAPELTFEGIGQAARNYVVYAMFNEISRIKAGFSMAGFGYSMLYPFTDNFIDSQTCSDPEKKEYNQIIQDQIEGRKVHPKSPHQLKTCRLLQAIESEYPRNEDSAVYPLLLMMLEAQEDSLRQQSREVLLEEEERLDISLYKGGVSVLIDRFFVKKSLTEADLHFYFGFGFFLQLADDLQDIKVDSIKPNQTIFTVPDKADLAMDQQRGQEEKRVNQMFHFVHGIFNEYQADDENFKEFILLNCYQLIYTSVFQSREFFSKAYLDRLEKYFPVTGSFLENVQLNRIEKKDRKAQDQYMKILDVLIG